MRTSPWHLLGRAARMVLTSLLALVAASHGLPAQDTILVRVAEAPAWGRAPVLREELRIGVLEGDERYSLGAVTGVAVDGQGHVWVADHQAATLRRYSPEGGYLGDVGRRGQGPGEFSYLMDIRTTPDGNVIAWDPLGAGVHVFDPDGRFVRSHRVPVRGMFGFPQNLEVDRQGRIYAVAADPPSEPGGLYRAYWLRLSPDGVLEDTVWIAPTQSEGTYHPVRTYTAVSPLGYVVTGRNDEYAFHRTLPDDRVVRIVREAEAAGYEAGERREVQAFSDLFAERRGEPSRPVPDRKPFWSTFQVDVEGRIWVARYARGERVAESTSQRKEREKYGNPPRTWAQPVVFDVLDPRGRLMGTLRFPNSAWAGPGSRTRLLHAQGTVVWVLEHGEFEEQYVVRYRIDASGV